MITAAQELYESDDGGLGLETAKAMGIDVSNYDRFRIKDLQSKLVNEDFITSRITCWEKEIEKLKNAPKPEDACKKLAEYVHSQQKDDPLASTSGTPNNPFKAAEPAKFPSTLLSCYICFNGAGAGPKASK